MTKDNHRCPCGSGRKYKKCCKDKQRTNKVTTLTFDMGEKITLDGYSINNDGTINLKQGLNTISPKKAVLSQFNEREDKKDKVTLNTPIIDQNNLSIYLNGVIDQFDYLFIIDTNSVATSQENIMFSASVMMYFRKLEASFELVNSFMNTFEHEKKIHGEKYGLVELIRFIINDLKLSEAEYIGIVTDHDLGKHENYNSGEIPVLENTDLYLPRNIKLIYASADKKNESFLSQLINQCDKEASRLLQICKVNKFS